ncbi:sigma-54 dependent transcriptional regulator [Nemorincola caseinilytica]|uniref:Sigma-54 dependent transcriptional regulator n=1 Tax=Nemorincola caseinilytica TaxID=2054315 RepID=A0ABP8N6K8_9BACT
MYRILIVDDDNDIRTLLTRFLSKNNYETDNVRSGATAIAWMRDNTPDLVLCDFRLEDMTATELLPSIREMHPNAAVIVITGYSDVKDAVEVIKLGAHDYVTKPLFPDEILVTIRQALAVANNHTEPVTEGKPTRQAAAKGFIDNAFLTGNSAQFGTIMKQVDLVAPTNFSVIIYGESGSGKEVIARQIHLKSTRADKPFIAIDCGALSRELAGSELFGHEKGAFTGAIARKTGSLELADTGTIFLDEIGNLSYDIQVSLLRVVQERKIRRVGGTKDIDIDVRIIIASNERLWDLARAGKFREDLYHRFNEFSIDVPPLRDRKKDIMLFAHYFLQLTNTELCKDVQGFEPEVKDILENYVWYGNLRELKNVIKRATLLSEGSLIGVRSLPFEIANYSRLQFDHQASADSTVAQERALGSGSFAGKLKAANIDAEYNVILEALKKAGYNKSKAARLLNVDRKTLYNKMKQFKEFDQ